MIKKLIEAVFEANQAAGSGLSPQGAPDASADSCRRRRLTNRPRIAFVQPESGRIRDPIIAAWQTLTISTDDTPAAADIRPVRRPTSASPCRARNARLEGGWGASSQRLKEQSGVLHRYLDGSAVRITAKSFYAHLIDLANAPARQGRKPSGTSFQKKRRAPTEHELEGLRKGNEQRAAEAQQAPGGHRPRVKEFPAMGRK